MSTKVLLIKSQVPKENGELGKWNDFNDAHSYIEGINTGKLLEDISAEKLGALISGIPTPWARAKLFKFAFTSSVQKDANISEQGLKQYYKMLCDEWKGLMAVIALYPDRIRFSDPVKMDVNSDDYNIAGAFGRMLFDDVDLWCNQDELAMDPSSQPFIQLIYYREHLIGGTSPMTGCFTGVDYSNLGSDASDIKWYRNGRFEDPMAYLTPEELQKVYLFIKNMNQNQPSFEAKINSCRKGKQPLDIGDFKAFSQEWQKDMNDKGHGSLKNIGPIAQYNNLAVPFSLLFKSDVPVYLTKEYNFTYSENPEYTKIGDIQSLLSDDKYVVGWAEDKDQINKLSSASVYYLAVPDLADGSCSYFSLPLSSQGLDIFKKSLSSMLSSQGGNDGNLTLSATINDAGQLSVAMVIKIDGEAVTLNKREYEIHWMISNSHVIMWPNFCSEQWKRYYLYSEFTKDTDEEFIPIFKKCETGELIKTIRNNYWTDDYQCEPTEKKLVTIKHLVTYPVGQGSELLKYNILFSDKPIAGFMVKIKESGKPVGAGFLIVKEDVKDLTKIPTQMTAEVGIDFGSNNTCVYYKADKGGRVAMPVEFNNYRTVIVGRENYDNHSVADNNELLFFSNYPADNGQLKSWLHEHDSRYIQGDNENEEIAGGVPVNRPNVLVRAMDEYNITTQAGILHYNMKWLNDEPGMRKKRAFLESIWLQTCAFLYQKRIKPTRLNWSFPGSMMTNDVDELQGIFQQLPSICPISDCKVSLNDRVTEAEAVCSYALSSPNFTLSATNMFLGIDVGGSTSDILLLAKDINQQNNPSLYRQSSVRLAAGVFFNTVIHSKRFREALLKFHEGHNTDVYVANIKEIIEVPEKAPYFLNCIFDQLKSNDFDTFYRSIADNAKEVFILPAYVTGLLLYYSGMLIGQTIQENHMDAISDIYILSFGKGGRLFHWLRNAVSSTATKEYYKRCVDAGLKHIVDRDLNVSYREEIEVDNKAEVAKGLCDKVDIRKAKTDDTSSDICGEVGIRFTNPSTGASRILEMTEKLTGDYFDNDLNYLDFEKMECFEEFFEIFTDFISVQTKLAPSDDDHLRSELAELHDKVPGFIRRDSEYRSAQVQKDKNKNITFSYHQPLIIAEGSCFLEKSLTKMFFK